MSSTQVSPLLMRSLDPVTKIDFVFLVFKLNRLFLDQFSSDINEDKKNVSAKCGMLVFGD